MKFKLQLPKNILILILALFLVNTTFGNQSQVSAASYSQIVSEANKVMGTKYVYGGTTTAGFDCSGFIGYVFKKVGITLPRTTTEMFKIGTSVSKNNLQPGDLVFFNTSGKGVSHAGIYIGNGEFINSSTSKGVSKAKINDPYYWGSKYIGAKRVQGVSSGITQVSAPVPTNVKPGQIGEIIITKNINLWKRDANNKLTYVRVLKVGEKYRVYNKSSLYFGQYGLGGSMYITNMPTHIRYTSVK